MAVLKSKSIWSRCRAGFTLFTDSESIAHVTTARLYSDLRMHGAKTKPASTDFSVVLHNQSLVFV